MQPTCLRTEGQQAKVKQNEAENKINRIKYKEKLMEEYK